MLYKTWRTLPSPYDGSDRLHQAPNDPVVLKTDGRIEHENQKNVDEGNENLENYKKRLITKDQLDICQYIIISKPTDQTVFWFYQRVLHANGLSTSSQKLAILNLSHTVSTFLEWKASQAQGFRRTSQQSKSSYWRGEGGDIS